MAGSASSTATAEGVFWEKVITFTFASGDTAEVKEALKIWVNGAELRRVISVCSTASGAVVTATVAIDDNADNEIFSVAALAEGSTTKSSVSEVLTGTIDVGVVPNTDPLSAYTVTVYLSGVR